MNHHRRHLIVYGDFNCPFSALASRRAAVLERRGDATIDWRAVEHDPTIPVDGEPVEGPVRAQLLEELDQVRSLLRPDEDDLFVVPTRRANTREAVRLYASVDESRRREVRAALFASQWENDARQLIAAEAHPRHVGDVVARWATEWSELEGPIVPVMVLPDGYVSRGLGALTRLRDMLGPVDAARGGP